jgi:endonuclease YncB( thermonuclease family)
LVPSVALADFTGRVVKVTDGDTITVLVHNKQIKVRLDSIDAPESKQAFGKRSQ